MFGSEGQQKLRAERVGIVGLGGIGSHLAQGLSYLGVGSQRHIDDDRLEETNLNRVVGATPADIGRLKVDVAKEQVLRILPGADVIAFPFDLRTRESFDALRRCTVIFGGVDHDGPRLVLTEFSAAYGIPLIDVASEIFMPKEDRPFDFGGRVVVARPGDYCLFCAGQIDRELAKQDLESPEVRELRRKHGYGLGSGAPAPSVYSLNGIVANLALMEFVALVTEIRTSHRRLTYKGMRGVVTVSTDCGAADCYTCKCIAGSGDEAGVNRYILPVGRAKPLHVST